VEFLASRTPSCRISYSPPFSPRRRRSGRGAQSSRLCGCISKAIVRTYPPPAEQPFESNMLHEWMTWTMDLLDDEQRVILNAMCEYCAFAPHAPESSQY